jgi:phage N-6-adenine-methyltransferase
VDRVLFSSASDEWATPGETYRALDAEFKFADDPCPLGASVVSGLMREWKSPCFVNPPYSEIGPWMEKAAIEAKAGKTVVLLVPSRTDTRWWHEYAMKAKEIRFIRGRLKFGGAKTGAPFPSCVIIFGKKDYQ